MIKLFEDYSELYKKSISLDDEIKNHKNNIIQEINDLLEKHGLESVDFFYSRTPKCYYDESITKFPSEVWISEPGGYQDESYKVTKLEYGEIYFGRSNYRMEYFDNYFDLLEVLSYLEHMTPEMWEQQKINQESKKFNI